MKFDKNHKRAESGVLHHMVGGPLDGFICRLYPHPYDEDGEFGDGWQWFPDPEGRYVADPDSISPLDDKVKNTLKQVNKKRTNIPAMKWVGQTGG